MSIFIEIEGENYMLNELITRYPLLESIREEIERAYNTIVECYEHDGKVLIVGNGGSAADAEHIVGELMKGKDWRDAMSIAADYTAHTIEVTLRNPDKPWYGVDFEATIPELIGGQQQDWNV